MKRLGSNKVKQRTFTAPPANHCRTSIIGLMKYPFTEKTLFSNIIYVWFQFTRTTNGGIIVK